MGASEALTAAAPSARAEEKSRPRLTSLDAIRGIAALIVVIGHSIDEAVRLIQSPALHDFLQSLAIDYVSLGRVGVVAFFCVSGYVIPFSFAHKRPVPSFLIARFFRLYPAYWASMIGALLLAVALGAPFPPPAQILANITMIQLALGQPDLIGVYWTLFYELVFYGLCLGAFIMGRMQSPPYLLAMVAGLSAIGLLAALLRHSGMATGVPIGLFMFLAIMHLGTLARVSDRDATPQARRYFAIGLAIILVTTGPIAGIGFIQKAANQRLLADVISLYVGLGLFFVLRRRDDLATAPLLFLGKISYSLYLMHPLCLVALVAVGHMLAPPFGPLFVLLSVPVASILLSTMTQHFVEEPSNRIGRRLRKMLPGA
jgi:peptidoglycan/LPS O-acetylase OafA/YrhL